MRNGHDVRRITCDAEYHKKWIPFQTRVLVNVVESRASYVLTCDTINGCSDFIFKFQCGLAASLCVPTEGLVVVEDGILD